MDIETPSIVKNCLLWMTELFICLDFELFLNIFLSCILYICIIKHVKQKNVLKKTVALYLVVWVYNWVYACHSNIYKQIFDSMCL